MLNLRDFGLYKSLFPPNNIFEVMLALTSKLESLRCAPTHRFLRVYQGEEEMSVKYKTFAKINFNHVLKNVSSV
jgi:hypothetical protein